jgi:hypothetical protein
VGRPAKGERGLGRRIAQSDKGDQECESNHLRGFGDP